MRPGTSLRLLLALVLALVAIAAWLLSVPPLVVLVLVGGIALALGIWARRARGNGKRSGSPVKETIPERTTRQS